SAYIERFATDPEPLLYSPGTGDPERRLNQFVVAMTTNFGTIGEDLMNRCLPVHLNPVGDLAERQPAIGNPRFEYLPANRGWIEAELRGMLEKWVRAGRPLDMEVKHPFIAWGKVVGGILQVNGYADFLGNYRVRRTADDPVRKGLGLMGAL